MDRSVRTHTTYTAEELLLFSAVKERYGRDWGLVFSNP